MRLYRAQVFKGVFNSNVCVKISKIPLCQPTNFVSLKPLRIPKFRRIL